MNMSRFRSHLLTICIALYCLNQVLEAAAYDDDKYNRYYYYTKLDPVSKMRNTPEYMPLAKGKGMKYKYKAALDAPYKGDIAKMSERTGSFLDAAKRRAAEQTTAAAETTTPAATTKAPIPKITPRIHAPAKSNETEAEKAERIHRTFEKLLTFVEIVGQVDNYVSTKWKNLVRTVSNMYEEEDDENRLGLKKLKGCPLVNVNENLTT